MPEHEHTIKKRKKTHHKQSDRLLLLPSFPYYTRSFLHKSSITVVRFSVKGILATGSSDGILKFWARDLSTTSPKTIEEGSNNGNGIVFIKQYKIDHNGVKDIVFNWDGNYCALLGLPNNEGKTTIRLFDMISLDLISSILVDDKIGNICLGKYDGDLRLITCSSTTSEVSVYDPLDLESSQKDPKPLIATLELHSDSVSSICFNHTYNTFISADKSGNIEYWIPNTTSNSISVSNSSESFSFPLSTKKYQFFQFKSATSLYEFKKTKTSPVFLTSSPNGKYFAVWDNTDKIHIFRFLTGKIVLSLDEGIPSLEEKIKNLGEDDLAELETKFGPISSINKKIGFWKSERDQREGEEHNCLRNASWDASSTILIYSTPLGIKLNSLLSKSNEVYIGNHEDLIFGDVCLFQNNSFSSSDSPFSTINDNVDDVNTELEVITGGNELLKKKRMVQQRSMIITKSLNFDDPRFYLFYDDLDLQNDKIENNKNKNNVKLKNLRDILNEDPNSIITSKDKKNSKNTFNQAENKNESFKDGLPSKATLHTTLGDIVIQLFPKRTPRTVLNFITLSSNNYYNNVIFHRVIPKFMIQTGDPLGNGTGGESCWGGYFEDEFDPLLKHEKFTVSMANSGLNTNGSQFFITTEATTWLDKKHSIFGKVINGFEVVKKIESLETDKDDKPLEDVSILSISTSI